MPRYAMRSCTKPLIGLHLVEIGIGMESLRRSMPREKKRLKIKSRSLKINALPTRSRHFLLMHTVEDIQVTSMATLWFVQQMTDLSSKSTINFSWRSYHIGITIL